MPLDETRRLLDAQLDAALARVPILASAALARDIEQARLKRRPLHVRMLRESASHLRRIADRVDAALDRAEASTAAPGAADEPLGFE